MSSLSPSLLVVGLIGCAVGGVLAVRTVRWIFKTFPKTFRPPSPTATTPVEPQTLPQDHGITCRDLSKQ